MALDHYVSQVHLKSWYSPMLGTQQMHAIRKSDLKTFPCTARSVCRIEDNNTNAYLMNDRTIEEFLLGIEPNYTAAVAKLRDDKIDRDCIYVIAGFVAYVGCCAPAAMRIHAAPLESNLESTAIILDRQGLIPRAPPALGSKTLTELLANKEVKFTVDEKFPQAIGISTIEGRLSHYGNSSWEILRNDVPGCPLFTSDFPLAIEATSHRLLKWIVPLAPDLAIRITPDIRLSGTVPDLSFAKFKSRQRTMRRGQAISFNRLIVRCAEDLVFYRDQLDWVPKFVARNRHYRIEAATDRIRIGTGFMNLSAQRIVPYHAP